MEWKNHFVLVEAKDTEWKRFSKPHYVYENPSYSGGETVKIESSARKIEKFLKDLQQKGLLNFVQKAELNYWVGNEFRGWGSDRSFVYVDKNFAEKIGIKGYFKWIDKGWGDYACNLEYDLNCF
jgi:hypothetical protein